MRMLNYDEFLDIPEFPGYAIHVVENQVLNRKTGRLVAPVSMRGKSNYVRLYKDGTRYLRSMLSLRRQVFDYLDSLD